MESLKFSVIIANAVLIQNARCDQTDGFCNGGALYICVEALKKGNLVAAICQKGFDDDTPRCANNFADLQLNGHMITGPGGDCPMEMDPSTRTNKKYSNRNTTLSKAAGMQTPVTEQVLEGCTGGRPTVPVRECEAF